MTSELGNLLVSGSDDTIIPEMANLVQYSHGTCMASLKTYWNQHKHQAIMRTLNQAGLRGEALNKTNYQAILQDGSFNAVGRTVYTLPDTHPLVESVLLPGYKPENGPPTNLLVQNDYFAFWWNPKLAGLAKQVYYAWHLIKLGKSLGKLLIGDFEALAQIYSTSKELFQLLAGMIGACTEPGFRNVFSGMIDTDFFVEAKETLSELGELKEPVMAAVDTYKEKAMTVVNPAARLWEVYSQKEAAPAMPVLPINQAFSFQPDWDGCLFNSRGGYLREHKRKEMAPETDSHYFGWFCIQGIMAIRGMDTGNWKTDVVRGGVQTYKGDIDLTLFNQQTAIIRRAGEFSPYLGIESLCEANPGHAMADDELLCFFMYPWLYEDDAQIRAYLKRNMSFLKRITSRAVKEATPYSQPLTFPSGFNRASWGRGTTQALKNQTLKHYLSSRQLGQILDQERSRQTRRLFKQTVHSVIRENRHKKEMALVVSRLSEEKEKRLKQVASSADSTMKNNARIKRLMRFDEKMLGMTLLGGATFEHLAVMDEHDHEIGDIVSLRNRHYPESTKYRKREVMDIKKEVAAWRTFSSIGWNKPRKAISAIDNALAKYLGAVQRCREEFCTQLELDLHASHSLWVVGLINEKHHPERILIRRKTELESFHQVVQSYITQKIQERKKGKKVGGRLSAVNELKECIDFEHRILESLVADMPTPKP